MKSRTIGTNMSLSRSFIKTKTFPVSSNGFTSHYPHGNSRCSSMTGKPLTTSIRAIEDDFERLTGYQWQPKSGRSIDDECTHGWQNYRNVFASPHRSILLETRHIASRIQSSLLAPVAALETLPMESSSHHFALVRLFASERVNLALPRNL